MWKIMILSEQNAIDSSNSSKWIIIILLKRYSLGDAHQHTKDSVSLLSCDGHILLLENLILGHFSPLPQLTNVVKFQRKRCN